MTENTNPNRETITNLAAIPDPADRAQAIAAALAAIPDLQAALRSARQDAVLEMRQTKSVAEVAEKLGISVPRVSQIAKGISRTVKRGAA